ncbi:MAG: DUF1592 domain-containing protein [Myxococcota bacterium]
MRTPFSIAPGLVLALAGCSNGTLVEEDPVGPPGVQAMSRLNRVEHENTLDDLLGIASRARERLPPDPVAEGFDTVAEGLVLTPAYAQLYERLTDDALARFFGDNGPPSPDVERIVSCDLDVEGRNCVQQIARDFLLEAWRRPPTDEDVAWVVALYNRGMDLEATPTEAIRLAMKGILLSPEFIFRPEPTPGEDQIRSLDGFEVATRLAYFLWSSTPDAELLAAAASGALLEPGGVAAQADRMLDDPRADALVENFAGQWLDIRRVKTTQPNPDVHPFFDDGLKASMQAEMRSVAEPFLRGNAPFDTLLTQQKSLIDRRLALHYTMLHQPGADGMSSLEGTGRQGLLTTAGWLSITSHPDETSSVRRGHWILEKLLCDSPPPPPPDVESTVSILPDGSVRQQEEAIRQSGDCAACHNLMDPLGYTLHGYGPVGLERATDRLGFDIDDAARLEGTPVSGAAELADWLLSHEQVDRCVTKHTFIYALGRAPEEGDDQVIDQATRAFIEAGRTFPALIEAIVTSRSFLDATGAPEVTP